MHQHRDAAGGTSAASAAMLLGLALLGTACSPGGSSSGSVAEKASVVHTDRLTTASGAIYQVHRVTDFDASALPHNSDLKMADGNLAKYAVEGCTLDVPLQDAPSHCDVYVQSDTGGTLLGYAFVVADANGARFSVVADLSGKVEPGGGSCSFGGALYESVASGIRPLSDPSRDFQARQMYSAWEKSPGNFLVSDAGLRDDVIADDETSLGVWHLTRSGNKLRIAQERWNFCYSRPDVMIDDVFYLATTLTKAAR